MTVIQPWPAPNSMSGDPVVAPTPMGDTLGCGVCMGGADDVGGGHPWAAATLWVATIPRAAAIAVGRGVLPAFKLAETK